MWYYFVVFVKGKCFLILPFFISKQHDPWQNSISFCLCHSNMIRFKSVAIVSRTRGYCYSQHTQLALLIPFIHICCSTSWLARCSRCEQDIFFFFNNDGSKWERQCLIQYCSTDLKVKTSGLVYYIIV